MTQSLCKSEYIISNLYLSKYARDLSSMLESMSGVYAEAYRMNMVEGCRIPEWREILSALSLE